MRVQRGLESKRLLIFSACPNCEAVSVEPHTVALTGPLFPDRPRVPPCSLGRGGTPEAVGSVVTSVAQLRAKPLVAQTETHSLVSAVRRMRLDQN